MKVIPIQRLISGSLGACFSAITYSPKISKIVGSWLSFINWQNRWPPCSLTVGLNNFKYRPWWIWTLSSAWYQHANFWCNLSGCGTGWVGGLMEHALMITLHKQLCHNHGSHIFGLTNFPDFSSIFLLFSSIFFSVLFNEFNTYKIYLTNTLRLKNQRKKKLAKISFF